MSNNHKHGNLRSLIWLINEQAHCIHLWRLGHIDFDFQTNSPDAFSACLRSLPRSKLVLLESSIQEIDFFMDVRILIEPLAKLIKLTSAVFVRVELFGVVLGFMVLLAKMFIKRLA